MCNVKELIQCSLKRKKNTEFYSRPDEPGMKTEPTYMVADKVYWRT